jgi:hypothetical protein
VWIERLAEETGVESGGNSIGRSYDSNDIGEQQITGALRSLAKAPARVSGRAEF